MFGEEAKENTIIKRMAQRIKTRNRGEKKITKIEQQWTQIYTNREWQSAPPRAEMNKFHFESFS